MKEMTLLITRATMFDLAVLGVVIITWTIIGSVVIGLLCVAAATTMAAIVKLVDSERHVLGFLGWIAIVSVGLIIITMLTRSALAQQVYTTVPVRPAPTEHKILPPPEYDYVYEGDLTIVMVKTIEELRILCNVNNPGTLACSIRAYDTKSCVIIMVEDEVMRRHGWTTGLLLRHEMGHCNGWTQAHEGQRSVYSGGSHWVPGSQRIRIPIDRWEQQVMKQWEGLCMTGPKSPRLGSRGTERSRETDDETV